MKVLAFLIWNWRQLSGSGERSGTTGAVTGLVTDAGRVCGVQIGRERLLADAVILACGGFGANGALRVKHGREGGKRRRCGDTA